MSATIIRSPGPTSRGAAFERRPSAHPTGEELLRRQAQLLQSTLEQIEEGVSVFDREGRLVAWNLQFIELLDLPRGLPEGTPLAEILWLQAKRGDFGPIDCGEAVSQRLKDFFEDLPTVRERTTPAGRTLQIRRRPMDDGKVITLYADVTDQRAAETRRAQAWAEAELANRAKSEFLAHMSHELRTPLNAIIGFSELMCAGILCPVTDKKSLEYIADIHASGLHLLEIVNDVLDMSKIEAGKLDLSFERVIVQRVVADTISMVSELASRRKLDIVLSAPPDDLTIFADERALKQIVLNLLSNAIKFSEEGGRIGVRVATDDSRGLVLDIEDHGIGMTADELGRALQPFAQAKPATTRNYGGTGLGLPIVKGLIDAHHGKLIIESTPGTGTSVRVMLPPHRGRDLARFGRSSTMELPGHPASGGDQVIPED